MRWQRLVPIGLLALSVLAACMPASAPPLPRSTVQGNVLAFPPAYYEYIVYIDSRLVAFTEKLSSPAGHSVEYAYAGDVTLRPFALSSSADCTRYTLYLAMGNTLPDGRLGLMRICQGESPMVSSSMYAYNWQTGQLSQLVSGLLRCCWSPKTFTWNPDMTRGVQEIVDGGRGTISWITPKGAAPMDIVIEDQGQKWNLKDYYEGKDRTGLVRFPAWSPDGKTIAFFASTYGLREEVSPTKPNIPYELYFMNASAPNPVQVLKGVANARLVRWSPDSTNISFSGCMGWPLKCGLWLYRIQRKTLTLIAGGDFQDLTWISADKIVAIMNVTVPFDSNQILEYPVESLLTR